MRTRALNVDGNFEVYSSIQKEGEKNLWLEIVEYVRVSLPTIVYFPTFLIETPQAIYLKKYAGETAVNRFYRNVCQDILKSSGLELTIETHILKRIEDFRAKDNSANWLSNFLSSPARKLVDTVFQQMANLITREVIDSWSNVFGRKSDN